MGKEGGRGGGRKIEEISFRDFLDFGFNGGGNEGSYEGVGRGGSPQGPLLRRLEKILIDSIRSRGPAGYGLARHITHFGEIHLHAL